MEVSDQHHALAASSPGNNIGTHWRADCVGLRTDVDKLEDRKFLTIFLFTHEATVPSRPRPPQYRGFTITMRHSTLGRSLWTSDQPYAETSSWQHATLTRERYTYSCLRWDSNQQTHALDRVVTGIGPYNSKLILDNMQRTDLNSLLSDFGPVSIACDKYSCQSDTKISWARIR